MSTNRDRQQFAEYREWQWCKHVTLQRYVVPWSEIVGRWEDEIVAVDACAGAGSYADPATGGTAAAGSPVIFARRAAAYSKLHGPGRSMNVFCVERNGENFIELEKNLAPFAPHFTTYRGALRRHVNAIAERIEGAPALILLDPIGLKPIASAADCEPLIHRTGKTDLFVTLHFGCVHRMGGWLRPDGTAKMTIPAAPRGALMLDHFFRTNKWLAIAVDPTMAGDVFREEREVEYLRLYFENVLGTRYRWKAAFPVRARLTSPVKYWFVHASDDMKPYMLMNDQIVELTEMLIAREYGPDVLSGFVEGEIEAHRATTAMELRDAVVRVLSSAVGGELPFSAIRDQLLDSSFGRVKQGAYSHEVKELLKLETVRREKNGVRPRIDDAEMITLVAPIDVTPSGAAVVPIRRVAA